MGKAEQHATKKDIAELEDKLAGSGSRLDAKIDALGATTKTLALEIVRTQTDVRDIKESMATKDHIELLMRRFDDFATRAVHYDRADAARGRDLVEFRVELDDRARRISALESPRQRPSP